MLHACVVAAGTLRASDSMKEKKGGRGLRLRFLFGGGGGGGRAGALGENIIRKVRVGFSRQGKCVSGGQRRARERYSGGRQNWGPPDAAGAPRGSRGGGGREGQRAHSRPIFKLSERAVRKKRATRPECAHVCVCMYVCVCVCARARATFRAGHCSWSGLFLSRPVPFEGGASAGQKGTEGEAPRPLALRSLRRSFRVCVRKCGRVGPSPGVERAGLIQGEREREDEARRRPQGAKLRGARQVVPSFSRFGRRRLRLKPELGGGNAPNAETTQTGDACLSRTERPRGQKRSAPAWNS